ncbi:unnamed protein product [Arctogadus glacialis]
MYVFDLYCMSQIFSHQVEDGWGSRKKGCRDVLLRGVSFQASWSLKQKMCFSLTWSRSLAPYVDGLLLQTEGALPHHQDAAG